jgi:HlyD family secretion protein
MAFSLRELPGSLRPRSRGVRYGALIALAAALAAGAYAFAGGQSAAATYTIHRGTFERQVAVSGSVVAGRDAELGFAATGRVRGVYTKAGAHVAAGTLLAEIENGDEVALLERSQAALAKAQADLEEAKAGTRPEEIVIAETAVGNAQSSLAEAVRAAFTAVDDAIYNRADALFTNPRTDPAFIYAVSDIALRNRLEEERRALEPAFAAWSRSIDLAGSDSAAADNARMAIAQVTAFLADASAAVSKAIPDQQHTASAIAADAAAVAAGRSGVDAAQKALVAAVGALASAERDLALKRAGSRTEDIAAGRALVASAAADVKSAQAALQKTRIVAPFAGVVTEIGLEAGEIVSPSSAGISMQSDSGYEIETFIPEIAIADVAVGQHATTTLDAYGDAVEFPATVIAIDPAETEKNGVPTYKTTLAFVGRDERIRSGMTAEVRIVTGLLEDAIVLPEGALGRESEGAYVMVQVKKDSYERRAVETGDSPSLGQVEITSGLSEGEVISLAP